MALLAMTLLAMACDNGTPPPPPFATSLSVKQLMAEVIEPAADTYWDAVGSTSDQHGITEHAPKNDDAWKAVQSAASTVAESGNALMLPGRAVDQAEWMRLARDLVVAGMQARAAAAAHDAKQVFDAGAAVYESCTACHAKYLIPAAAATTPASSSPAK